MFIVLWVYNFEIPLTKFRLFFCFLQVDEVMETGEDIEVSTTPAGVTVLSLKLLPMTKLLQSKHGLRHGDYQRYRGYCSR